MIDKTAVIHPSSIVEEGAIIGAGVRIGPFCFVGSQVEIGAGTELKSHVVVNGITKSAVIIRFTSSLQLVKQTRI